MSERKRVSAFDMPALAENKSTDNQTRKALDNLASQAGYNVRHASQTDSEIRPLTRKRRLAQAPRANTVQLNIAVEESTRDRFWDLAQTANVTNGEGFLSMLMDAYEKVMK